MDKKWFLKNNNRAHTNTDLHMRGHKKRSPYLDDLFYLNINAKLIAK